MKNFRDMIMTRYRRLHVMWCRIYNTQIPRKLNIFSCIFRSSGYDNFFKARELSIWHSKSDFLHPSLWLRLGTLGSGNPCRLSDTDKYSSWTYPVPLKPLLQHEALVSLAQEKQLDSRPQGWQDSEKHQPTVQLNSPNALGKGAQGDS